MTDANVQPAVHKDNLLGICHAVGEDVGINPIFIRLGLGTLLLFNLELPFIVYGVLGLIVLVTRLLVPGRLRAQQTSGEIVRLETASREIRPANDQAEHARAA